MTRLLRTRALLVAALSILAAMACFAPVASAAPPLTIANGDKITPTTVYPGYCTMGVVGYDTFGNLVGITAGHCTANPNEGPGGPMWLHDRKDMPPIGTIAKVNHGSNFDYMVIDLDENVVAPKSVGPNNFRVDKLGPKFVNLFSGFVCKNGQTTKITCGLVTSNNGRLITSTAWIQQGDSGGPLSLRGGIVGIGSRIDYPGRSTGISPFVWINIHNIIADINVQGGVGAGFVPVNN